MLIENIIEAVSWTVPVLIGGVLGIMIGGVLIYLWEELWERLLP